MTTIWLDGEWLDRDTAKVSVFDHGLLYGDGVFEGIRVYGGKVFRLAEHMDRLYASARAVNLDIGISKTDLTEQLYEQDFERDSNVIEVFIGRLRRKLDPDERIKPIETLRGRGYRFALARAAG